MVITGNNNDIKFKEEEFIRLLNIVDFFCWFNMFAMFIKSLQKVKKESVILLNNKKYEQK